MTKLFNSEGKQLYQFPDNIKKAQKRRRDKVWGNATKVPGLYRYIIHSNIRNITI